MNKNDIETQEVPGQANEVSNDENDNKPSVKTMLEKYYSEDPNIKARVKTILEEYYSDVPDIIEEDVKDLDPKIKKMFSIGSKFAFKMVIEMI